MKEKKTNISIYLLLLISLTACIGKASAVLQDSTCIAPCWRNIELGKTEISQAISLLRQLPEIDPDSIKRGKNFQTMVEVVSARFQYSKEAWMEIVFIEEKAIAMTFYYEEDISLSDAIKKFGEPEYLYPSAIQGDPFVYRTAQFLYPDQGICLFHEYSIPTLEVPETYRITKVTNIRQIYYVDPALSEGQIQFGCFRGGDENQLNSEKQDWQGFSEYIIP